MGSCFSWFRTCWGRRDNERKRLLEPSSATKRKRSRNILSDSLPDVADEQTAFNRILQEAAENFIDVAALDTYDLDQEEYLERLSQYQSVVSNLWQKPKRRCFLRDIHDAERVLCAKPIRLKDYILIKKGARKMKWAKLAIKVEHKEDMVVPFQSSLDLL